MWVPQASRVLPRSRGTSLNGIFLDVRIADDAGCSPGPDETCLVTRRFETTLPGETTFLDADTLTIATAP